MADPTFDRARFEAQLTTRTLGRHLLARAEVASTNDEAWDALGAGMPDGTVVVADAQTAGRGRLGRPWVTVPERGLALSLLLHAGCDRRQAGAIPLVAGLALARGIARLGIEAQLKWPNDLVIDGRKLAGILCEGRRDAAGADAVVVGVGVNVSQRAEDFPPELAGQATSLSLAGLATSRELVAAEFLDAFEPLWDELQEGDRASVLDAWQARASFWGSTLTVRTPAGTLSGIACGLDPDGGLVLTLADGRDAVVMAGDVDPTETPA